MSIFTNLARDRAVELGIIDRILPDLRDRLIRSTSKAEQDWLLNEIVWHESRRRVLTN
jgi:hypothetical protein